MELSKGHIVVIDDDSEMRELLQDFLTKESFLVTTYPSAVDALKALPHQDIDVIISDVRMAQLDGMEFVEILSKERPDIPVILATGHASVESAIEAMKKGAYHYIVKPFKLMELGLTVDRALDRRRLAQDNQILRREIKKNAGMEGILGKSPSMRSIFDLIIRVSNATANILITGESGTGKEMVAKAIHAQGNRKEKPFIAINCTAIPETLLESELFGHAKGSFTGATNRKKGLIEEAHGGTLFLDEIGDLSPPLQVKLLRVLQERKIRPVGDNHFYDVDVRVIAATHKNLKSAIRENLFREDLYYRLSVIPIALPPLRERAEDIPFLAEYFLKKYSASNSDEGKPRILGFTPAAISKLVSAHWAGNVRELENLIERVVVLSTKTMIDADDIPNPDSPDLSMKNMTDDFPTLAQLEERYLQMVLRRTSGRKDKAAQILGINRRTLYRKEREYGWPSEREEEKSPDFFD